VEGNDGPFEQSEIRRGKEYVLEGLEGLTEGLPILWTGNGRGIS
jgi:hypothetical protein